MPSGLSTISPQDLRERVAALQAMAVLDTPPEEGFDAIARLGCDGLRHAGGSRKSARWRAFVVQIRAWSWDQNHAGRGSGLNTVRLGKFGELLSWR